jgi:hypothetical protein
VTVAEESSTRAEDAPLSGEEEGAEQPAHMREGGRAARATSAQVAETRPWKEALLWVCLLGVFFFAAYGFSNHYTASRGDVGSLAFDWERGIPFWAWTIIPYWSIDLFYGLSLLVCATRKELRLQALRLALATVLCVAGFLLFPLRMSFERPPTDGLFGALFSLLGGFDLPYNQAPSLHVCLAIVLWDLYRRHAPRRLLLLVHVWSLLIVVSVLTTYQHHFIDVPAGAAAGLLCCYLVPWSGGGWFASGRAVFTCSARAAKLGAYYTLGAALFAGAACVRGGWAWLLLWPAAALACVAGGYLWAGPGVMRKNAAGRQDWTATWLLAPYRFVAALSRRWFLAGLPAAEVLPGLWIGGYPSALPAPNCGVLDLCAEYPQALAVREGTPYRTVPMLDLVAPSEEELIAALAAVDDLRKQGPVLVHCALGLGRSATVAALWAATREKFTPAAALALVEAKRPGITLPAETHRLLAAYAAGTGTFLCRGNENLTTS